MTPRDALFALGGVLLAVTIAGVLALGALAMRPDAGGAERPRVLFFDRTGQLSGSRPSGPDDLGRLEQRVPAPARALVPVERHVSRTFADAAGYLLLVLGVSGALVLAHDQVVASYRASLGGWRVQTRLLLLGVALVLAAVAATVLLAIVLLGGIAAAAGPGRGPLLALPLLGVGTTAVAVILVALAAVALVGFAAAAWRLGDALFDLGPLARLGERLPAPLVALVGATIVFLLAQIPLAGAVVAFVAVAYALGAVARARLAHTLTPPQAREAQP